MTWQKKLGVSVVHLSAWENGKSDVPVWVLRQIEATYDLSAEEAAMYDKAVRGEPIDEFLGKNNW